MRINTKYQKMVFKYRGGNKTVFQRDLDLLKRNCFFAPSFEKLNDPCETMILSSQVDKQTNFVNKLFGGTKETGDDLRDITQSIIATKESIGIYSLSNDALNELMWAHYANGHKGFCLGFETSKLLENTHPKLRLMKVKYSQRLPKMGLFDLNNDDRLIKKFAGRKSKSWSYEKEIRVISDKFGEISYPQSALKSVYLGLRMSEIDKGKILETLAGRDLEFFQITQDSSTYSFDVRKYS